MDERLLWMVPGLVLGLGLWRPWVGLVVVATALPLFGTPAAGPYLGALDAIGLSVCLIGLRAWATSRGERSPRGEITPALGVWVFASMAAFLPLLYHPPSWRPADLWPLLLSLPDITVPTPQYSWRVAFQLLVGGALYLTVRVSFRGRSLRPLAVGSAVGTGFLVLVGLAEPLGVLDLSAYRPIGADIYEPRLHSLFFHSGWLAQYLVIALPFGVAGLACGGRRSRYAAALLAGLTAVALVLTQQRGAWIATLAQLALLALLLGPAFLRSRRTLLAAVGLTIAAALAVGLVVSQDDRLAESLGDRFTLDLSGRWLVWQRALATSWEANLAGAGSGAFALTYGELYPCREVQHCWLTAHNVYIHTLYERGLPGLVALLLVVAATVRTLHRALERSQTAEQRTLALGLSASLTGAAVYGLVQYVFFLGNVEWLLWILLAAASLLAPTPTSTPESETGPATARSFRAAAWAAIALALVFIPVRYADRLEEGAWEQHSFGFLIPQERPDGTSVRWTNGRAARRFEGEGRLLAVELFDGHPRASDRNLEVTLSVDGVEAWRGPVGDTWQTALVEARSPDKGASEAGPVTLGIHASPAFRPWSDYRRRDGLAASRDIRSLGVVVRRIYWDNLRLEAFRLEDSAVYSDPLSIKAGDLGVGPYVVGPSGRLELEAPLVSFHSGFSVEGELVVGNPRDAP